MEDQLQHLLSIYWETTKISNPGVGYSRMISDIIRRGLGEGILPKDMEKIIRTNSSNASNLKEAVQARLEYIWANKPIRPLHRGLLKEDTFYYHPLLQEAPPAPVITINDDGTFSEENQNFFLKIKDRFTVEEALEYLYKRFPEIDRNEKRDLAAIRYLYDKAIVPAITTCGDDTLNPVDLLLFSMDYASFYLHDTDNILLNALDIQRYIRDGLLLYQDKKEGSILAGVNCVV